MSESAPRSREVDIAIVGAGLAGTSAAIALGRAGHRVALIDAHATFPREFRAEKVADHHLALFDKLDLREVIDPALTPVDRLDVYRFGSLYCTNPFRQYGFAYADVVNRLRAAIPSQVDFTVGHVADFACGPDRQRVVLSDGVTYDARLVVLATGYGDRARRQAGISRVDVSKAHTLCFGFNLAHPPSAYDFDVLTYFARRPSERFAYFTVFPIGDTMRVNFFVYRTVDEPWARAFRQDPRPALKALMPQIAERCHDFEHDGGMVDVRQIGLHATEGHRRSGVVLLGDAFRTTCPAPGVGVLRAMTDVERLCSVHVPRWLETPGMGEDKIAQFYDDPIKRATDDQAVEASLRSRGIAVGAELKWQALRVRNNTARRIIGWTMHAVDRYRKPASARAG